MFGQAPEIDAPFFLGLVRSAAYSMQQGFIFKKRHYVGDDVAAGDGVWWLLNAIVPNW